MTELSAEELRARIAGLNAGPWTARGRFAADKLREAGISVEGVAPLRPFDFTILDLPLHAVKLEKSLTHVLRPHWEKAITKRPEIKFRESLDSALTHLQLIELAIETGYLPIEQVPAEIKNRVINLLWANPVRSFVRDYDYVGVEFLAQRLGIQGTTARTPPPIIAKGSVLFSAFLATLRRIERDKSINAWLDFLDDYVLRANEQNEFYEYLEEEKPEPSNRFRSLTIGARSFTVELADFFVLTTGETRGMFGLFYAYWFQKMFGYELTDKGYVRDNENWEGNDSWAFALNKYFQRLGQTAGKKTREADEATLILRSTNVLAQSWSAAIEYARLKQRNGEVGRAFRMQPTLRWTSVSRLEPTRPVGDIKKKLTE